MDEAGRGVRAARGLGYSRLRRRARRLTRALSSDSSWRMVGRSGAVFWLSFGTLALLGACRDRGSADQDSRPLPTPEPPASLTPAAPRAEPAGVAKRPAGETRAKPTASAIPAPVATAPVPVPDSTGEAPSVAAGGGAPAPAPSLPPLAAPSAACLSRCQGALQGCLAQPVDGGVPGFANLDLCKKAFEACQAACK